MKEYLRFIVFALIIFFLSFVVVAAGIGLLFSSQTQIWSNILSFTHNYRSLLIFWFSLFFVVVFVIMFLFSFFYDRMG